jgi:hypothetical protein
MGGDIPPWERAHKPGTPPETHVAPATTERLAAWPNIRVAGNCLVVLVGLTTGSHHRLLNGRAGRHLAETVCRVLSTDCTYEAMMVEVE